MNVQTAVILFLAIVVIAVVATRLRPAKNDADTNITAAVNLAISKEFPMGQVQIDVKTFDGVVILGGITREFAQKKRAEEIAQGTPGVASVDNRITVRAGN